MAEMAERKDESTDNPESKEEFAKRAGTILVSDVPREISENDIWIHFQKKRNSGGEVLSVTMKTDRRDALVYFEDYKIAEAVVQRQGHVIKGHAVEVKLYEDDKDKKRRTVLVSGLPIDATKSNVIIHFQKKRNGGGEIEDVDILETGKALVVFEKLEVAKAVVNKEQIFQGKKVLVKPMGLELEPIKALKQGDIESVGKEERTILVSGLPEGATKNIVHIHFQRKKNNGGEVEDTMLLPGEKEAWVIFEDPKVAQKVVNIEQRIQGEVVHVKLLKTETQPTERSVEPGTVLVTGIPEGMTENRITIHFQKKRNGGGEVSEVKLSPDGKSATVTFADPEVAKTAVSKPQTMRETPVTVISLDNEKELVEETPSEEMTTTPEMTRSPKVTRPEVTATPEVGTDVMMTPEGRPQEVKAEQTMPNLVRPAVDQVFSMVSATVNPELMNTASQYFWTNVFNVIQNSCGVHCQPSVYGVLLTGRLSQVTRAGEILELKWRKHCQDLQNFNQLDAILNQAGTSFPHQHGTTFNQGSTAFNQGGSPLNEGGTTFKQHDTNFNQGNTNFNRSNTHLNPSSTHFTERGANSNQSGMTLNQTGANFNQSVTTFNQGGSPFNQHGTTNSIGRQEFMSSGNAFYPRSESQLDQENANYSLHHRQPGRDGEGQLPNEPDRNRDNSINLHPHSDHDMRNANQPPHATSPGFKQDTENPPKTPPGYIAETSNPTRDNSYTRELGNIGYNQHLNSDNRDVRYLQDTANHEPFGNQPNTHTDYIARSPNSTTMENCQARADETNPRSIEPSKSGNGQKGTTAGAGSPNTIPRVNGTSLLGDAKPAGSPNGTTNPQPSPVNDQNSLPPNPTNIPETSTTSTNNFASSSNDEEDSPSDKPPILPRGTTNPQSTVDSQKTTTPNNEIRPEGAATTNNQFASSSNVKADSRSEKPASLPGSTINPQPKRNDQPDSLPDSADYTTNPQPLANDQQDIIADPTTRPKNLTTSNNQTRVPLNNRPDSLTEKPPCSPDYTTNHQPPSNDQRTAMTDPTTASQTSSTPSNEIGVLSSNTPEPPSKPAENTPNNQPQHNQQQTIPNQSSKQQTSTPENTNTETSSDMSPVSKPGVKPRTSTETDQNSDNKPQKRPPIPAPRQSKPGSRQNAANFSSQPTQPRQGSPSPTEPINNSVIDKPTTATQANKEIDQDGMTEISKNLIKADEGNDKMEDEVD